MDTVLPVAKRFGCHIWGKGNFCRLGVAEMVLVKGRSFFRWGGGKMCKTVILIVNMVQYIKMSDLQEFYFRPVDVPCWAVEVFCFSGGQRPLGIAREQSFKDWMGEYGFSGTVIYRNGYCSWHVSASCWLGVVASSWHDFHEEERSFEVSVGKIRQLHSVYDQQIWRRLDLRNISLGFWVGHIEQSKLLFCDKLQRSFSVSRSLLEKPWEEDISGCDV